MAEMHGGRVEVESEEGVGSTFLVCLPVLDTVGALFDDENFVDVPAVETPILVAEG